MHIQYFKALMDLQPSVLFSVEKFFQLLLLPKIWKKENSRGRQMLITLTQAKGLKCRMSEMEYTRVNKYVSASIIQQRILIFLFISDTKNI